MAHFAQINSENKVIQVIVVRNEEAPDELTGKAFIESIGLTGQWVQTSYNNNFRGKFAALGDVYDETNDEFVTPEPSYVPIVE